MTIALTSCGRDNDPNNAPAERKVVGYQVDYTLNIPATVNSRSAGATCGNLFTLFDKIEVGYIDENGAEQREVLKDGKWTKTVIYQKGVKGYLRLCLSKPSSLDVESLPYERYDQGVVCKPSSMNDFIAIWSDGTQSAPTMGNPIEIFTANPSFAVTKNKLEAYLSAFSDEVTVVSFSFEIK